MGNKWYNIKEKLKENTGKSNLRMGKDFSKLKEIKEIIKEKYIYIKILYVIQ